MPFERKTRFTWTNWTFGFWWGKIGTKECRGLDLGPLEIMWTEVKPKRTPIVRPKDILRDKERRRPQPGEYPKPAQMRGRRIVSPFPYDSGPVRHPDLTGRRGDLAQLKADQDRLREEQMRLWRE